MDASKLLTIGHSPAFGQEIAWDQVALPNVVDCLFLVIDLSTIPKTLGKLTTSALNSFCERVSRLLAVGHDVVIFLPSPSASPIELKRDLLGASKSKLQPLAFVPFTVNVIREGGTTITCQKDEYRWFVEKMKRWDYHFVASGSIVKGNNTVHGNAQPIATNQEGKWLAEILKFHNAGAAIFLPTLAKHSNSDLAARILKERFPELAGTPEPEWAKLVDVPGMSVLHSKIASLTNDIKRLHQEVEQREERLSQLAEFRRLIFESGIPLEQIVARTFRELGGEILPRKYDQEEFVLMVGDVECLVEVKGLGKSAAKENVHQLLGHINAAEAQGKEPKGILVVNAWRQLPLGERETNGRHSFPPNVIDYAQRNRIALLTGAVLLSIYRKFLSKEISGRDALNLILGASGIVKAP